MIILGYIGLYLIGGIIFASLAFIFNLKIGSSYLCASKFEPSDFILNMIFWLIVLPLTIITYTLEYYSRFLIKMRKKVESYR